jgi:hypothetical protein
MPGPAVIDAGSTAPPIAPSLTVVLVAARSFDSVRKILRCLRAQTIRDRIELLIVVESRTAFAADPEALWGFARHEIFEVGEIIRMADAKAAAVGRATAPVVVFAEDHCFPEPDWGEALLAAHGAGWTGVGPAVGNANPRTALSRSEYLMHWAPWMGPDPAGPVTLIPWHNSSYRRSALLDLRADLPRLLAVESFLQAALRQRGHQMYLEPAAQVSHTNISRPGPWLVHGFLGGRLYAARRTHYERLSWLQRLQKAVTSPMVPLVRMWRLLRILRRTGRVSEFLPRTLPLLTVGLVTHAAGEAAGYVLGEGDTETRYSHFELNRTRDVVPSDLAVLG